MNSIITVSIVDDDKNDRLLAKRALGRSNEFHCVGVHSSAAEALNEIPRVKPAVVLMDIRMPGMCGIECTRRLKATMPELKILMLTGEVHSESITQAWRAGSDGCLTKPLATDQLLASFTLARLAGSRLSPEASRTLRDSRHASPRSGSHLLTPRENEFMKHLAEGLPHKQIAVRMGIGSCRVHNLQRQAYRKLDDARNGIEAVCKWYQLRLAP